jgi:hypothetical protein
MAIDAVSITAIIISAGTCITGIIAGIKFIHCHSGCCDLDCEKYKNKSSSNSSIVIDEPPQKNEYLTNISKV